FADPPFRHALELQRGGGEKRRLQKALLDPAQRLRLAQLVVYVHGHELPAFAEQVEPHSRSTHRGEIGSGAAKRAFELPADQREDGAEHGVRTARCRSASSPCSLPPLAISA